MNINTNNKFITINKITKNNFKFKDQFYKTCIKNKYIIIDILKKIILIVKNLQKFYINLKNFYKLAFILRKKIFLLFNKFINQII